MAAYIVVQPSKIPWSRENAPLSVCATGTVLPDPGGDCCLLLRALSQVWGPVSGAGQGRGHPPLQVEFSWGADWEGVQTVCWVLETNSLCLGLDGGYVLQI